MSHDVISAFIDNEPFDPQALASALADPNGRDLLIDFIALRLVVAADLTDDVRPKKAGPRTLWRMLAAAAILLALGGGYAAGLRMATGRTRVAASDVAPAPTRVIELRPGIEWHQTGGGH
jgi:hypothetical protein